MTGSQKIRSFSTPADLDYVHDPQRIGTMKNVISINGGVQLDLMGQENAESAGTASSPASVDKWISLRALTAPSEEKDISASTPREKQRTAP